MTFAIPIKQVVAAQHLRCVVSGEITNPAPPPPSLLVPEVMDIYTGWIRAEIGNPTDDHVARDKFTSFIPLGTKTGSQFNVQGYPEGADAIVSASISSFATEDDADNTCAIDSATVKVVNQNLPGFAAQLLVLTANLAIQAAMLSRVSYQVTVLARTQLNGAEFPNFVVSLDPDTAPV